MDGFDSKIENKKFVKLNVRWPKENNPPDTIANIK